MEPSSGNDGHAWFCVACFDDVRAVRYLFFAVRVAKKGTWTHDILGRPATEIGRADGHENADTPLRCIECQNFWLHFVERAMKNFGVAFVILIVAEKLKGESRRVGIQTGEIIRGHRFVVPWCVFRMTLTAAVRLCWSLIF